MDHASLRQTQGLAGTTLFDARKIFLEAISMVVILKKHRRQCRNEFVGLVETIEGATRLMDFERDAVDIEEYAYTFITMQTAGHGVCRQVAETIWDGRGPTIEKALDAAFKPLGTHTRP